LPGDIPGGIPITPLVEVVDRNGKLTWPADPRTGEDYLDGWFMVGNFDNPLPNGYPDLREQGTAYYVRYYGHITSPADPNDWPYTPHFVQTMEALTEQMLTDAFGDRIDVRSGFYGEAPPYTQLSWDVAEEFSNEGFTKMLLARETTDNNRYANDFMTGGYVRERRCELGTLDDVINLQPYIESYPEGSTIAMVYVTRGLPWGGAETTGWFGSAHPWSKEIYFENAYLNYLSWKEAIQRAYGDRYNLVFTKGDVESDLMEDNLFTFGLSEEPDLLGFGGETIFYSIRNAIQFAKADGIDKIIVAPCHWNYDTLDTILRMKEINGLPLTPLADLQADIFEMTHCEDGDVNEVTCGTQDAAAEITVAPSYSFRAQEFATAYYVVLRGTLERFGLYPQGEEPVIEASQLVTKLAGGTVEVTTGTTQGAKIEIPGDPYPTRPQDFTPDTAIPVNDPADSYDCMWEDTTMTIGYQASPPAMTSPAQAVGPAVHFGPYRTFFNRDVTLTIPYNSTLAGGQPVAVYIYNHVTEGWDPIVPESVDEVNELVTFKTQVLGLFQASAGDFDADGIADSTDNCLGIPNPGQVNGDSDSFGDACDNCPAVDNADQADSDLDNAGDVCDNCPAAFNPNQADNYPPGGNQPESIGDACDCEGDFDCNGSVDATDVTSFLVDFGRSTFFNPCTNAEHCNGDFDCNVNVDANDVTKFLEDFGRSQFFNPCPACVAGAWCSY
jgi:hypothetical protein